jgi:hypothetical protein
MIRGVQYSMPLAGAGVAALAAATVMAWLRFDLNAEIVEQRSSASIAEASLSSQIAAKSIYERERLDALREQIGRFRMRLGTDGTWERVVRQFGPGWNAEMGVRDDRSGYSIQYGIFELVSPTVADWPRIVEAVRESEAVPGVGIAEFEMKASGGPGKRMLDLVRILVVVETRGAEKS